MPSTTAIRFVGVLSSPGAETAARHCVDALGNVYPEVLRWEVCVHPPLTFWQGAGYAVRVLARLAGGGVVCTRGQAGELLQAVGDAFDGMEELLQQAFSAESPANGWLPTATGRSSVLPAG